MELVKRSQEKPAAGQDNELSSKNERTEGMISPVSKHVNDVSPSKCDFDQANQFLNCLVGDCQPATFQTFSDAKATTSTKPRILHGRLDDLWNRLVTLNDEGAGIFVSVNETDLDGRSNENIVRVRALFLDLDGSPLETVMQVSPKPHVVTQTSPGRNHCLWMVSDCAFDQFKGFQLALAKRLHGDPKVTDLARCCRVPGFFNRKGEPFLSHIIHIADDLTPYSLLEIVIGLKLTEPFPSYHEQLGLPTDREVLQALRENEDGDAALFKRLNQGRFCYDHAAGQWCRWQEHYWAEDLIGEVFDALGGVIDSYAWEAERQARLALEAAREENKDQRKFHEQKQRELLSRVTQLQTLPRKERILRLAAQGADGLGIRGDEWDADPWVLGCSNGVVNLRDGSFREGYPGDFIKTVCPTEWRGIDTPCPKWEGFIIEILVDESLQPDPPTPKYVHRLLGYGITGLRQEQALPVYWGEEGRNGKGTLFETLAATLGPIARKLPSEILLQSGRPRDSSGPRPDLMDLRGRRLCWCNETNQGRRLDLSVAKELAGADTISARQLQGKFVNFIPTHLLILSTNYLPKIPSNPDDPIWDRIHAVPFRLKFVENPDPNKPHERKRNKRFLEDLQTEASGILAWLVRGALMWQREGLNPPENVRMTTQWYRDQEDVLGQFTRDCCEPADADQKIQAKDLFQAYTSWCAEWGHTPTNMTVFGTYMSKLYKKEGSRLTYYKGLRLFNKTAPNALPQ